MFSFLTIFYFLKSTLSQDKTILDPIFFTADQTRKLFKWFVIKESFGYNKSRDTTKVSSM